MLRAIILSAFSFQLSALKPLSAFSFLLSALLLTGCAADDVEATFDQQPIRFAVEVEHAALTRAAEDGVGETSAALTRGALNEEGDLKATGYGVFGYKVNGAASTQVFTNQKVEWRKHTPDTPEPSWTYAPLQYWNNRPATQYYFSAYAPYLEETAGSGVYVTKDDAGKTFTVKDIPQWQDVTDGCDLLVADASCTPTPLTLTTSKPAKLTFAHKLARLTIIAREGPNALPNTVYVVTRVTMGNAENSSKTASIPGAAVKGTYKHTYGATPSDLFTLSTETWGEMQMFTSAEGRQLADRNEVDGSGQPATTTLAEKFVVPFATQSTSGTNTIPVTVEYKFGTDGVWQQNTVTAETDFSQFLSGNAYVLELVFNFRGVAASTRVYQKWQSGVSEEVSW